MARTYAITFSNVTVSAAQDLVSILPATQKPVKILGYSLSQSTDVGDAAEMMLRVAIVRGNTTVGSGGSSFTPLALDPSDGAAGAGARINDTTAASAGTAVNLWVEAFNARSGTQVWFPPESQPISKNAEYICLRLLANPGSACDMSGTLIFEEL